MRLMLDSGNYQCRHCGESSLYSDSLTDAGLFLAAVGIAILLFTFVFDSHGIGVPGLGLLEMLGYVVGSIIVLFGVIFIRISK